MASRRRTSWEDKVTALATFRAVHGHCRVPAEYKVPASAPWPARLHGLHLGQIALALRISAKSFSPDRFALLEALGFVWSLSRIVYRTLFVVDGVRCLQTTDLSVLVAALHAYHALHGDLEVPQDFVVPTNDNAWPSAGANLLLYFTPQTLMSHFYELAANDASVVHGLGLCTYLLKWPDVLKLLAFYKTLTGSNAIPIDFEVPSSEGWPAEFTGRALGKLAWYLGRKREALPREKRFQLDSFKIDFNAHATWSRVVDGLRHYQYMHGSTNVPATFVVPNAPAWPTVLCGMRLGHLFGLVARASVLRLLPPVTQQDVEGLNQGSPLCDAAPLWESTLLGFETYQIIHGHVDVPKDFCVPMASSLWPSGCLGLQLGAVATLLRESSSLHADRIAVLEKLGLKRHLIKATYVVEDGCSGVARVSSVDIGPSSATTDRPRGNRQWSWEDKLEALVIFRDEHRHLAVPSTLIVPATAPYPAHLHGLPLGKVVSRLRHGSKRLRPDRLRDLDTIGFLWRVRGSGSRCRVLLPNDPDIQIRPVAFDALIEALVTFQRLHGHLDVPDGFVVPDDAAWPTAAHHVVLNCVIPLLRAQLYELSDADAERVHAAGIVTDLPNFDTLLRLVAIYRQVYRTGAVRRDFAVPSTGDEWPDDWRGLALGDLAWTLGLKAHGLDKVRRARLKATGYVFNSPATWARIVRGWREYYKLHGSTAVPNLFVVPASPEWPTEVHGLRLGHWVDVITKARGFRFLPAETVAAIDALTTDDPRDDTEDHRALSPPTRTPDVLPSDTVVTPSSDVVASSPALTALIPAKTLPSDTVVTPSRDVVASSPASIPSSALIPAKTVEARRLSMYLGLLDMWLQSTRTRCESTVLGAVTPACPPVLRGLPIWACLLRLEVGQVFENTHHRPQLLARGIDLDARWRSKLEALATFKAIYNHLRVPRSFVIEASDVWPPAMHSFPLGDAVSWLRKLGRAGVVEWAVAQLDALGFKWDTDEGTQNENTVDLTARHEPARATTILASSPGEIWDLRPVPVFCLEEPAEWSAFLEALYQFRDYYGHLNVPFDYMTGSALPLGHLVQQLNNGHIRLSRARRAALVALKP
ncbi:hypothetical protein SDRG_04723 [Saprolegnia diclina VS20]|uniref:Helicase-associated domain-containing protein n=1 Tax=Saprolegnia diclina (strain VS20) TaxID=1156394 RepID=T0QI67_SAPDV|nr:hypothetical protein SDRG_04723 [Saprolegnia diclina VS20]EQC37694.1 hypothetical protein SDRG_04723 [Saprolegnia diclina VS20]|eukprot:XP_008608627.1 hypothetical protein SDRG_04723 [Saprolegnia diclina VS20]